MKKFIRNLSVFILIIVMMVAFSSSYASLNMDRLAYVLAIGIDTDEKNKMQVTFQFSTSAASSESGSNEKTPFVINTVTASSLSNAVNLMNAYLGKELNLSHCKIIIFSEEFASLGISDEIYTLTNDTQLRPTANILITKCTAKTYMEQTNPELEKTIYKYYDTLTNSSSYTGYIPDATLGSFFNTLICRTCDSYAILAGVGAKDSGSTNNEDTQKNSDIKAGSAPINGQNSAENIGIAVFKSDKLVGELNALETISFLTMRNELNNFLISVPDPLNNNSFLDIYVSPSFSNNIKVYTDTQSPYVKLKIKLTGKIHSMSTNSDYLSSETLKEISNSCNSYLEYTFKNYLYKTSKEFKSDITNLGKYALKNFLTWDDYEEYNWLDNYQNAYFDVEVDTSIESSMLITET